MRAHSTAGPSTAWAASLFEHSPIGQALVDPDGRLLVVNPALARFLGWDADELVGMRVVDLTHPEDREETIEAARRLLANGGSHVVVEKRYLRSDGSIVWGRVTSAMVADPIGRVRYSVAQVEDITERQAAVLELQRSERRHRAILDHASDLVVVLDAETTVTYASPAVEHLLGRTVEDVLGTPALDHVWPEDRELAATELLDKMVADSPGPPTPLRLVDARGEPVAVEALATNLLDDDATQGIVVSLRDVRERDASTEAFTALDMRYRALADAAQDAILTVDDHGLVWSWNGGARRTLGLAAEDAIGRRIDDVLPGGLPAVAEVVELDARHGDGHLVPVEVSVSAYEHGGIRFRLAILRDISRRRAAEAAARTADRRFRSAFDAAPIGIAVIGLDGSVQQANAALCRIVGYDARTLTGMRFHEFTHPDDLDLHVEPARRVLSGRLPGYRLEKRYVRGDGDVVWAQLSVSLVRDEDGQPVHWIAQVEDITERKAADDGLAYQAHHDHLTGLLNRHAVLRRLDQAFGRRHGTPLTALFVDLDGFKDVNDTHGHAVGDDVLRSIAARMTAALRPSDAAGRLGGDEFIAVLEGIDGDQAEAIRTRLSRSLAEPVPVAGGAWVQITASVGFATATAADVDASALLARADRAMYEAKGQARSRV